MSLLRFKLWNLLRRDTDVEEETQRHESTFIGNILISMGIITQGQVARALEIQGTGNDKALGHILISLGYLSHEQLKIALHAQEHLRSKNSYQRAMAQAEIAKCGSKSVISLASRVKEKAHDVRCSSSPGHDLQVIAADLLRTTK